MWSRAGRAAIIISILVLGSPLPSALGQESGNSLTEAEVERIASGIDRELMSPFCQGLTLENCPTRSAAELRAEIRDWLREGRSERWIRDALVARYGEGVLGAPRFRGLGILAWVLPGIVLLAALVGVAAWMRRHVGEELSDDGPLATDERRRAAAAQVDRDLGETGGEP